MNDKKYIINSDLINEWNWDKNNELKIYPESTSIFSHEKVWWKGTCGHQWNAEIKARNRGNGCPYCGNKYPIVGKTDLNTINPKLAKEWHPIKNGNLKPTDVTAGSGKKVWWLGSCNHEWDSTIASRNKGTKCPYCSNQKVLSGYNDLSTMNPELAKEWHPIKNNLKSNEVTPISNKKIWWKCSKGHEWEARISSRTGKQNNKCPYCSNKKVWSGYNDLATTNPKLVKEWHPTKNGDLKPTDVTEGSEKKVWWKCSKGHEWQAVIYSRKNAGCPKCSDASKVSFNEKAIYYYLSKLFPDIKENYRPKILSNKELDIFIPNLNLGVEYDGQYYHQSIEKDLLKNEICSENNIQLIRIREQSCIDLNNSTSIDYKLEKNNEKNIENAIKFIINYINSYYNLNLNIDINIKKDISNIYELMNYSELQNSLAIINPRLSEEWHPTKNGNLRPTDFLPNSNKKVWWLGKCNHEWIDTISHRNSGNRKCPICSGKQILVGYNDLATTNHELIKEWHPTKNINIAPTSVTKGSHKEVWWKCTHCNHEYKKGVKNKINSPKCPNCKK